MIKEEILETDNYVTIQNTCREAQSNRRMMCVIGYPGAGKTSSLLSYASINPNVYYIRVRKSMTDKDFYRSLLGAMGFKVVRNEFSIHFLMNKLSSNLNMTKKNNLLIIDEAGKLTSKQLEFIHELRDLTEYTTGLILAGPEYFEDNLKAWKAAGKIGIPELVRRIQDTVELDDPTFREVEEMCGHYKIKEARTIKKIYDRTENFAEVMNEIYKELLYRESKCKKKA